MRFTGPHPSMPRPRSRGRAVAGAMLLSAALLGAWNAERASAAAAALTTPTTPTTPSRYSLAGGCYALRSASTGRLITRSLGFQAAADQLATAYPIRMQAAALGQYLLYGPDASFVSPDMAGGVTVSASATGDSVWQVDESGRGSFVLSSASGRILSVDPGTKNLVAGAATAADPAARFSFTPTQGCASFPEAQVNATGTPPVGASPQTEVRGTIDAHTHATAFDFIGGDFHCGRPWHPLGVVDALPDCATIQGPQGVSAPVQNFLDFGSPVAPHDTRGWSTFHDWPGPTRLTYEGEYYTGIKRAWLAGLRVMVTDLVDNEALCNLMTMRRNPCNDMASVEIQARDLHAMQDYIDAQSGGPGKGWFRIVTDPFQARRVINDGKLAVVEGIEVSRIFGCGVHQGVPECDRAQIDRGLRAIRDLGVSSFYPVHKFDNALGGTKMDGGALGAVINAGNKTETGSFWNIQTCTGPQHDNQQLTVSDPFVNNLLTGPFRGLLPSGTLPVYPPGPHCNVQGLTDLGDYVIRRMMQEHFIIEIDHMDARTADQALTLMEATGYSGVISPHSWSSPEANPRIYRLGGFITPIAGSSPTAFVDQWRQDRQIMSKRFYNGFGYGSDMNGLADQSQPTAATPIHYPFASFDGSVTFGRERWGDRVFDVNTDGVANYGMYADWLEALRTIAGAPMMTDMFRGAEAYLQMWERASGVPATQCRPVREAFSAGGLATIHLRDAAEPLLLRAGQPTSRANRAYRYCTQGSTGAAAAEFGPAGRVVLIASTARGARALGIGPGASARRLAGTRRIAGGMRVARTGDRGSRYVYGVRRGRVVFTAVATAAEVGNVARLRTDLRDAGVS